MAVGECLGELLRGSGRRWRRGHAEMQYFAVLVGQDQQDLEDPEGGRGDGEEIHRHEVPGMCMEEGLPSLASTPARRAILADGGIGDCNA